jgi:hypothetical protein
LKIYAERKERYVQVDLNWWALRVDTQGSKQRCEYERIMHFGKLVFFRVT